MNNKLLGIFQEVEEYHWWFAGRKYLLKRLIKKHPESGGMKILDVGCGTGGVMRFLSAYGRVWGVDKSPRAVEYCLKNDMKNVRLADATKLPFRRDWFDLVALLDVMEHIANPGKALVEAGRVLKPNGRIIITVPATPAIWSRHDSLQGHHKRYDREELMRLATDCGLEVGEMRYFNFLMFFPIAVVRILSRLRLFEKLGDYDSKINFDIAKIGLINKILTGLFKLEIRIGEVIKYPWGVSLAAVLTKVGKNGKLD